jgi:hypothetical protein
MQQRWPPTAVSCCHWRRRRRTAHRWCAVTFIPATRRMSTSRLVLSLHLWCRRSRCERSKESTCRHWGGHASASALRLSIRMRSSATWRRWRRYCQICGGADRVCTGRCDYLDIAAVQTCQALAPRYFAPLRLWLDDCGSSSRVRPMWRRWQRRRWVCIVPWMAPACKRSDACRQLQLRWRSIIQIHALWLSSTHTAPRHSALLVTTTGATAASRR